MNAKPAGRDGSHIKLKIFYMILFKYLNHNLAIASAVSEPAEFDVAVGINMSAYELLDGSDNPE